MTSLNYRIDRLGRLSSRLGGRLVTPLILEYEVTKPLFRNLIHSVKHYLQRALHLSDMELFVGDVEECLLARFEDRVNITPNGAVVPKSEFALEYNLMLSAWCEIGRELWSLAPEHFTQFRLTPNIRLKFGVDFSDNLSRPLNTAIPHSDAWVEGPWGMNIFLPLLGDTENNFLQYFNLKRVEDFRDEFLDANPSYVDMQWVREYYEEVSDFIPRVGCLYISDYAAIHRTFRNFGAGPRVSLDSTLMVGNKAVHPDRECEYVPSPPEIGRSLYAACLRSENDAVRDKLTSFSHYTTSNIKWIPLNP